MANRTQAKTTAAANPRRPVKYPHLRRAALEMGYHFTYLWRVLDGRDPHFKGRPGLKAEFWKVSARITAEKKQAKAANAAK